MFVIGTPVVVIPPDENVMSESLPYISEGKYIGMRPIPKSVGGVPEGTMVPAVENDDEIVYVHNASLCSMKVLAHALRLFPGKIRLDKVDRSSMSKEEILEQKEL